MLLFSPDPTVGGNNTNKKKGYVMARNKRKNTTITDHHIIPGSRHGDNGGQNIKRVPHKYHDAYHRIFANLTPAEIYDYLAEVWFNPKKSFIQPEVWLSRRET